MPGIDDFLKMLDEQDYSRALKKEKTKKAVKETISPKKTEDELLQEEVVKTKRRKKAKELTTPPLTKQEALANKVKEMETQDKYNVLTGEGKPESGADAVDRLLKALLEQNKLMYDAKGNPQFKGKVNVGPDFKDLYPKGKKGSNFAIAQERMDDLQSDLKIAQTAKEQGITLQEAKRNKQIEDKYNEYLKKFNVSSSGTFDGKKVVADKDKIEAKRRYLARMQTQNFFSK